MPDPRIKVAYELATRELDAQVVELKAIRNRILGTLWITTLITAIAAIVGRLRIPAGTDNATAALPGWAVWTLMGLSIGVGLSTLIALAPSRDWREGPTSSQVMERQRLGANESDILTFIASEMWASYNQANKRMLDFRRSLLYVSIALNLIQVVILLTSLAID
ncbi:hypothetical protein [Streptomyces sp. NPDC005485]|uniref:hypothetical protein n=1 Tax=Streptomyces sp. NPDC005485 TaxID=3155591 RepID=UPI0033BD7F5C